MSRIKTVESLAEKLEAGRYGKWSEIDDLLAFSMVVPTLLEEDEALQFLKKAFIEKKTKLRGSTLKAPDVFRFDTTRFIGALRPTEERSADEQTSKILFEVQVRSAFEHAWSVTTHALTYKGELSWKRLRLAAELKAAVEQLDMLILGFDDASAKIPQSSWPEIDAKVEIIEFIATMKVSGTLPEELIPRDLGRYADNAFNLVKASKWSKGRRPNEVAEIIINTLRSEMEHLGPEKMPRSISLWQFTFGTLTQAGILGAPLAKPDYYPLLTGELESLYPATQAFAVRFDIND